MTDTEILDYIAEHSLKIVIVEDEIWINEKFQSYGFEDSKVALRQAIEGYAKGF
jgi:hypothetical protein